MSKRRIAKTRKNGQIQPRPRYRGSEATRPLYPLPPLYEWPVVSPRPVRTPLPRVVSRTVTLDALQASQKQPPRSPGAGRPAECNPVSPILARTRRGDPHSGGATFVAPWGCFSQPSLSLTEKQRKCRKRSSSSAWSPWSVFVGFCFRFSILNARSVDRSGIHVCFRSGKAGSSRAADTARRVLVACPVAGVCMS